MSTNLLERPKISHQEAAPGMQQEVDDIVGRFYGAACSSSSTLAMGAELTPEQIEAVNDLAVSGYEFTAARYGTSYPVSQAGRVAHLGYNNADHIRTFQENAERLDDALGLGSTMSAINEKVVPPWHDADQTSIVKGLPRVGEDETRSTELLTSEMRRRGLPRHHAEVAAYGILATRVVLKEDGAVAGQLGGMVHDYPSKEAEWAAKCAATNDLAGIYGPRGPLDACLLYAQRMGVPPNEVPPLDDLAKHFTSQKIFLDGHRFPLEIANTLFTGLKGEVIRHTEMLASQVEAGTTTNPAAIWGRIVQQNIEFLKRHS